MLYSPPSRERPHTRVEDCLPEIVRRLDAVALSEVQRLLASTRADRSRLSPELESPHEALASQHELWRRLLKTVASELDRLRSTSEDFRRFSERYFSQLPGAAREDVLVARLEREAESRFRAFGDRRAVREGLLDFDAYRERHVERVARRATRIRLMLFAMEELGRDVCGRLGSADAAIAAGRFLEEDAVLLELAQQDDFDDLAWLALRVASGLLAALLSRRDSAVPSRWMNHAIRTAFSSGADVWLQRTALEILAGDPASATEMLTSRLRRQSSTRDDWFVRARAARLLASNDPDHAIEVFRELDCEEGDAIAIAICRALEEIQTADGVELLREYATTDARPKVRYAANHALARTVIDSGPSSGNASVALAEALLAEPDLGVLEATSREVLEVMRAVADDESGAAVQAALTIRDLLESRVKGEPSPAAASRLAELRFELARVASPPPEEELTKRLQELEFGDTATVDGDFSRETVARATAAAALEGYGLYARRDRSGRWRIRRGEVFRTRLWRVLHELRRPSPSKRGGYPHTQARAFRGALRAHPVALGEVTPTTVPGERRQVSAEGGWGPYLPMVDDVLDAQLTGEPVEIATTLGITRVIPPRGRRRRWRNALRISWRYHTLDELRLSSLRGVDEQQRSRFLTLVREELDTRVRFRPHFGDDPVPPGMRMLLAGADDEPLLESEQSVPRLPASGMIVGVPLLGDLLDTSGRFVAELFERGGVRVQDLAIVIVALLTTFLVRMFWVRLTFDRWRKRIPLSVGGWGTRGKSGTERLKAGMFCGMGYDVFVKTTGCEAMFIHAPRRLTPLEIFIYRPYDKASIWEQRDMLGLANAVGSDVFLWECMALNPRYVNILQAHWMRDDLVTLTNAYPDHEDVQGPAGTDVAETIAQFIPPGGRAITSEREMLPVFRRVARERDARLDVVGDADVLSIPDDVMERFPYREHPRNIALVTRLARELGIDPEFALFAMADHVVPDLGVLKEYPTVNVLGRSVRFVNSCSANERAGFLNNWERMKLDELGTRPEAKEWVVTVVNNRHDRVSRSVVFADILVRDIAADRHVLIGTNLAGLRNYLDDSLDRELANLTIVDPEADAPAAARRRLDAFLARVRIVDLSAQTLVRHLQEFAESCGAKAVPDDHAELESALDDLARTTGDWKAILAAVGGHSVVRGYLDRVEPVDHPSGPGLVPDGESEDEAAIGRMTLGKPEEIAGFWIEMVARAVAYRSLHADLEREADGDVDAATFHARLRAVWRGRFWHTVVSVEDPEISGDGIVINATRAVPPGFAATLVGTQNIKGTGLDFVYRWVELDTTLRRLEALPQASERVFRAELMWLLGTESLHLLEALVAWRHLVALPRQRKCSPREVALIDRALSHLAELAEKTFAEATSDPEEAASTDWRAKVLAAIERALDPLDAVWRRYRADRLMRMLAAQRISHPRLASEMRELVKRQKGGWLAKRLGSSRGSTET